MTRNQGKRSNASDTHSDAKPKPRSEEEIVGWLRTHGYPLELRVGQLMREAGWDVKQSYHYADPTTQKPRELDLLAFAPGVELSDQHSGPGVAVELVVSCKQSFEHPWVVLAAPSPARLMLGGKNLVAGDLARDLLSRNSGTGGSMPVFELDEYVGHSLVQAFDKNAPDKEDRGYVAIRDVVQATLAVADEHVGRRAYLTNSRATFALPLVIFSGDLYEYRLHDDGADFLRPTVWSKVLAPHPQRQGEHVLVHVITPYALQHFLQRVREDLRALFLRLKSELPTVLAPYQAAWRQKELAKRTATRS